MIPPLMVSRLVRQFPNDLGRWWLVLALVYLALILHLGAYFLVAQQCTSTTCRALAGTQVGLAVSVIGIAIFVDTPRFQSLRWGIAKRLPPALALTGMLGLLFVFGVQCRPEWVYCHMALALSGFMILLYRTLYDDRYPRFSKGIIGWGLLAVALAIALLRVRALAYAPDIHILDEPWTMGWAVSYLRIGQPSDWLMGGVSGIPYYALPRYYALVAMWFQTVGVGLWEGRLFSLLLTAASIALTTQAARHLFNRQTAVITLIALLSSSVVTVGLRLRHDVGVTLALSLALWCYSLARQRSTPWLHVLAGACVGLGVGAHYHAIGLSAALAVGLYLPDYLARLRARRWLPAVEAWAFVGGAAGAGALLLAAQVLPDIPQFLTYLSPRSPRDVPEFIESLTYHIAQIPSHSQLEFVGLIGALAVTLIRRNRVALSLALSLILSYLAISLMASVRNGPFDYYSVPLTPLFGLLVGYALGSGHSVLPMARVVLVAVCFLIPQLGYSLRATLEVLRINAPLRPTPPPAAQWVLDHVPLDQTVAAEHYYFLWLYPYRFLSPLTPFYLPPAQRPAIGDMDAVRARWIAFAPDVIIFDNQLATSGMLEILRTEPYLAAQGFHLVFTEMRDNDNSITVYQYP